MSRRPDERPELSVILVTDTFATIEKVVAALSDQGSRDRLELVIVTPSPEEMHADVAEVTAFGGIRVVPDGSIRARRRLAGGRPGGRGASRRRRGDAPLAQRGMGGGAARGARSAGWTAVVPGFGNANPSGALSWAGFLDGLRRLARAAGARREMSRFPVFNAAYRRAALLELGPRLDRAPVVEATS